MNQSRRTVVFLALGCALGTGCKGSTGPSGPTVASLQGSWVLVATPVAAGTCLGAYGNTYYFSTGAASGASVLNVAGQTWDIVQPARGYGWTVTGNFTPGARTVQLNFWHTLLSVGEEFDGTIADDGTISGTIRDPKPGYSPHWVSGSCSTSATGRRVGP